MMAWRFIKFHPGTPVRRPDRALVKPCCGNDRLPYASAGQRPCGSGVRGCGMRTIADPSLASPQHGGHADLSLVAHFQIGQYRQLRQRAAQKTGQQRTQAVINQ